MKREYLRAVIWPRQKPEEKPKQYRYAIVGVLVTEEPIDLGGKLEVIADGSVFGIGDLLECVKKRDPKLRTGDASNVLVSLEEL